MAKWYGRKERRLAFHGELSRCFQSVLLAFSRASRQRDPGPCLSSSGGASDTTSPRFSRIDVASIAACGVALTFWIYHEAGLVHGMGGERLLAMVGSLSCTFVGMGLLAYLDRHATGSPEGRLAAAYALASALTILFVVYLIRRANLRFSTC